MTTSHLFSLYYLSETSSGDYISWARLKQKEGFESPSLTLLSSFACDGFVCIQESQHLFLQTLQEVGIKKISVDESMEGLLMELSMKQISLDTALSLLSKLYYTYPFTDSIYGFWSNLYEDVESLEKGEGSLFFDFSLEEKEGFTEYALSLFFNLLKVKKDDFTSLLYCCKCDTIRKKKTKNHRLCCEMCESTDIVYNNHPKMWENYINSLI